MDTLQFNVNLHLERVLLLAFAFGIWRNVQCTRQFITKIFDGENGELITRLKMPHRVPFGFHGLWVTGEELGGHYSYNGEE